MGKKFKSFKKAQLHYYECVMLTNERYRGGSAWRDVEKPFSFQREVKRVLSYMKKRHPLKYLQFAKKEGFEPDSEQPPGKCYFIGCGEFVKIGFSINPYARLKELQTGCPLEMAMLGIVSSEKFGEKYLHKLFDGFRERGEWFRIDDKIQDFIDREGEL